MGRVRWERREQTPGNYAWLGTTGTTDAGEIVAKIVESIPVERRVLILYGPGGGEEFADVASAIRRVEEGIGQTRGKTDSPHMASGQVVGTGACGWCSRQEPLKFVVLTWRRPHEPEAKDELLICATCDRRLRSLLLERKSLTGAALVKYEDYSGCTPFR